MSISVDQSTNRLVAAGITYDASGNQLRAGTVPVGYDMFNRANYVSLPDMEYEAYGYSARNERIVIRRWSTSYDAPREDPDEVNFYGAGGELLGAYRRYWFNDDMGYTYSLPERVAEKERIYFGGRLVSVGGERIVTDRLGSVVRRGQTNYRYYPYGQEMGGATAQNKPKFGTYTRDTSGLDYAMNRYYNPAWGRFTSPDPYQASGGVSDPGSWNRYAYVQGDPVNYHDPEGLQRRMPYFWEECWESSGLRGMTCVTRMGMTGRDEEDGGGGGGVSRDPTMERWDSLSEDCKKGLTDALKVGKKTSPAAAARARVAALDRAIAYADTIISIADGTTVDWTMIAAIGIRETGFRNINQQDGNGVGVFQIDIGKNPSVTVSQASDIAWAAQWAANTLASNYARLAKSYPSMDATHLLQATAASWNLGVGGITGNPETIDIGSPGNNYGSNILNLMDCFRDLPWN